MAITSWPWENADTTEVQYSRLFRLFQEPGVDTGLGVSANSSGMQVFIAAGFAQARGFALQSTAQETRGIEAAGTGLRTDAVVVRFSPTANAGTLVVLKGPGGAALPTLQATEDDVYDVLLATVAVRGGTATIASSDITDRRQWVSTRVRRFNTVADRPAAVSVPSGTLGYDISRGVLQIANGASWLDYKPTLAQSDITGLVQALAGKAASSHTHAATDITSGVFNAARVPPLPTSRIVSGRFDPERMPGYRYRDATLRSLPPHSPGFTTITMPAGRFQGPPVAVASLDGQGPGTALLVACIGTALAGSVGVSFRNMDDITHTFRLHLFVDDAG